MKSNQIAQIAGVSVRTLRHYHGLGLMAEPPRQPNGYRDYSALDLARLLRIKRLASLGFSLADIKTMLDADDERKDEDETGGSALDNTAATYSPTDWALEQLDAELDLRIKQLREQRRTIALLRKEQLDPSLPIRFAQLVRRLYSPAIDIGTASLTDYDSAALTVAGHLYNEEDLAELERFANRAEELDLLDDLHALELRIHQLPADATAEEKTALVEDAMTLLQPILPCFKLENWEGDVDEDAWTLLESLLDTTANEAQIDVNTMIDDAIVSELRTLTAQQRA